MKHAILDSFMCCLTFISVCGLYHGNYICFTATAIYFPLKILNSYLNTNNCFSAASHTYFTCTEATIYIKIYDKLGKCLKFHNRSNEILAMMRFKPTLITVSMLLITVLYNIGVIPSYCKPKRDAEFMSPRGQNGRHFADGIYRCKWKALYFNSDLTEICT